MSLINSLSKDTRQRLEAQDIVFDEQLITLSPVELEAWIGAQGDRQRIERFISKQIASGQPRGVATELLCGLLEAPSMRTSERVVVVRQYVNNTPWSAVSSVPGTLTRWFACRNSGYPTRQRYGSCAGHATGTSLHLRGGKQLDPDLAPSRRYLYVKSGQVGNHGTNEGRSLLEMQTVLDKHGYLLESECPTGDDDFDDLERYDRDMELRAEERRCRGTVWVDGSDGNVSRLNLALDLVKGRVTGEAAGLLIAVKVYENWARSFQFGLIRRHHPSSERLLGGHALVAIDVIELEGKLWVLCANSWGPEFASRSPIGVPGVAICSLEYMKEIMYHGAALFCRNEEEFHNATKNTAAEKSERPLVAAAVAAASNSRRSQCGTASATSPLMSWRLLLAIVTIGIVALLLPDTVRQYVGLLFIAVSLPGLILRWFPARLRRLKRDFEVQCQQIKAFLAGSSARIGLRLNVLRKGRGYWAGVPLLALAGLQGLPAVIPASFGATLAAMAISNRRGPVNWTTLLVGLILLVASMIVGDGLGARLITAAVAGIIISDAGKEHARPHAGGAWLRPSRLILTLVGAVPGFLLSLL